jgi:hypothetical protein
MTRKEAATLRGKWKKLGNPVPCKHIVLLLEHSDNGYLTGNYVCTTCGKQVVQTAPKKST